MQCHLCRKSFSKVETLNHHLKYFHDSSRKINCELCEQKFLTKKGLHSHKIQVHSEKRNICEYCDMRFATKSCLRQHTECVHLKVRYSCNRCEKDFSQHTGLRRHISEIHEKTDNYQCKQCRDSGAFQSRCYKA